MAGRMTMSLEAALEEERQEIENLIMQQARGPSATARSPSPYMSPRSPVRSMLDVVSEGVPTTGNGSTRSPQPAFRSMLDVDAPAAVPVRSMLDVGTPPPSASGRSPIPSSAQTSPTLSTHRTPYASSGVHHRSASDATTRPDFGPRSPALSRTNDITTAYQFSDIYATNVGQSQPVRRSGAGPSIPRSSSIGEALRGADLSSIVLPGEGRKPFSLKNNKSKSKSPSNRFALRSNSPGGNLLGGNSGANRKSQGNIVLDKDGQAIDMNLAYRRLSDANLAYGGSNLSSYARKKTEAESHGRLAKTNMSPYGEVLTDDDSDDDGPHSSDEEDEDERGRKLTTRAERNGKDEGKSAKSLLAAAEDERKEIAAQPQYRSLFEPAITVTGPGGGKPTKPTKAGIHPATSFDQEPVSGQQTPNQDQENEDVNAIKSAQNLQLVHTSVINNDDAHRSIQIIYRGEYVRIQRDAEDEHRRLRKYLVATDLSEESTHALEWAVGTVLRDGDTLIAIYCMDEEATGNVDNGANQVPDDPKSMREQAAALNTMAKSPKLPTSQAPSPSPFEFRRRDHMKSPNASANPSPAPSWRGKTRMAEERERAANDIHDRVAKLLRKTQLQVRVIVECIHCKSPKHLITEVIDIVNPTLVILGSRGRSALKGTLLGSFSNYLVTKSSVPVMVARKRLRKKSKYQPPPSKQINNLSNPSARSLQMARVD
ncbi:universal stress protein [Apiospora saccharicola]|uniref:Universal stress protein n=1 Tax=Apiospora saccharicola TaxID=335842 RepID=A0ABR1U412_9PEZI